MVQLLALVLRLTADVDAEPLVEVAVLLGDDDREVRIAAAKRAELLLHERGQRVRQAGDRERDEHLVGVQARVAVAEVLRLELADGLDRLIANDLELKVDALDMLEGVHNERTCGTQARGGLTGHHGAIGHDHGTHGTTRQLLPGEGRRARR